MRISNPTTLTGLYLLMLALLAVGLAAQQGTVPAGAPEAPDPALLAVGEANYDRYCASCHGVDGGGLIGPPLAGNDNLAPADYVVTRLLLGGDGMPPYHPRLTEEGLAGVASYIRTAWNNQYGGVGVDQVARQWWGGPEDPARLFDRACAPCHGADGGGSMGPPLVANPRLASAEYVVGKVLQGRGGMPAFDGLLTAGQVAAVAGHVRTSWGNDYGPVAVELVGTVQRQTAAVGEGQDGLENGTEPRRGGVGATAQPEQQPSGAAFAAGPEIYARHCQVCHGGRGAGGIGPSLADNPRLSKASYTVSRIVMGGGGMPAFTFELSSAEIAAVATLIRTSWGNEYGAVSLGQAQSYHGGGLRRQPSAAGAEGP